MTKLRSKERHRQLPVGLMETNRQRYGELYDSLVQELFNYGMKFTSDRELVKDCIHDVFVKLYVKSIEDAAVSNPASYLLISLRNRLIDKFRHLEFDPDCPLEDCDRRILVEDVEGDYLAGELQQENMAQVARLMKRLTDRQREAITLYYLEERDYDEVCKIMNMNYHSMRNLMYRGMLKLREVTV